MHSFARQIKLIHFPDLLELQNHVDGIQIEKVSAMNWSATLLNLQFKRKPVAKDTFDRANIAFDIDLFVILGTVTPVLVHNIFAISFVDSF